LKNKTARQLILVRNSATDKLYGFITEKIKIVENEK